MHTARLLSPPSPQRFADLDEDSLDGAMELTLSAPPPGGENPSDVSFLSKIDKWSWAAFIAPSDNMLHKSSGFSSLDYDTIYNDGEEHYLHLTPHTSHLTPHTSHLTPHTSHLTPHTSHLTPHTSHLTPQARSTIWTSASSAAACGVSLARHSSAGSSSCLSASSRGRWAASWSSASSTCTRCAAARSTGAPQPNAPARPHKSNPSCSTSSPPDITAFYFKLLFWNLMLAVCGCFLVVVIEPAAAGSGIDHVSRAACWLLDA
jgi:hypothetical protein